MKRTLVASLVFFFSATSFGFRVELPVASNFDDAASYAEACYDANESSLRDSENEDDENTVATTCATQGSLSFPATEE